MDKSEIWAQLVEMSRGLGVPERDYVILGEGNTSARVSEGSFAVKASGHQLHQISPEGFVELHFAAILAMLELEDTSDEEIARCFQRAKVNPSVKARPSIESIMHAVILDICGPVSGAQFVGHTHPTAVNAILCAQNGPEMVRGRLFPDHIVFCGAAPAYVPYIEPGLPLARLVKRTLDEHLHTYGEAPKTIFLQNHGLIAVGKSAAEVESITAMTVKSCRVLAATAALGGPRFLTEADVNRIYTHPSELYRRKQAGF